MEIPKRKISYLNGPVSWYEFLFTDDKGNKKMIHLFGDVHNFDGQCNKELKCMKRSQDEKSECYDFLYFLEELFSEVKMNKQYADFFIEIPYIFPSIKDIYDPISLTNTIIKIFQKFGPCIKRNKKDCKYLPNVRMHFTDIRTIRFPEEDMFSDQLLEILTGVKQNTNPINSFFDLGKYIIIDFLSGIMNALLQINAVETSEKNYIVPNVPTINPKLYQIQINELGPRQNMINLLLMILQNICEFMNIIVSSDNYIQELDKFLDKYRGFLSTPNVFLSKDIQEFNKVVDRLKRLKHPKSSYSVVGQQLAELEKDNVMVNGKNIASLIKEYTMESCKDYLSKNNVVENLKIKFQEFLNQIFQKSKSGQGQVFRDDLDIESQPIKTNIDLQNHYAVVENQVQNILNMYNKFIRSYNEAITLIEFRLLDAFILSRLFRTFSSTKKPHTSSILSIIYSGDIHTVYQVEFFEKYLGLKPIHRIVYDENKKDYQCLHDKNFGEIFDL